MKGGGGFNALPLEGVGSPCTWGRGLGVATVHVPCDLDDVSPPTALTAAAI